MQTEEVKGLILWANIFLRLHFPLGFLPAAVFGVSWAGATESLNVLSSVFNEKLYTVLSLPVGSMVFRLWQAMNALVSKTNNSSFFIK